MSLWFFPFVGRAAARVAVVCALLVALAPAPEVGAFPGAGAAALAQAETEAAPISIAEAFFIQRDPRTGGVAWIGSFIIWFLLLLSIVSLGLIGAMASLNRRERILPEKLAHDVGRTSTGPCVACSGTTRISRW